MYGMNSSEVYLFPGEDGELLPGQMRQEFKRGHRPGIYRIGGVVIYFMKEYDPRTIKAMRELREWLEEDANLLAPGPPKESESGA